MLRRVLLTHVLIHEGDRVLGTLNIIQANTRPPFFLSPVLGGNVK